MQSVHAIEPGKTRSIFAASLAVIASEDPLCAASRALASAPSGERLYRVPARGELQVPCDRLRSLESAENSSEVNVDWAVSRLS